MPELIVSLDAGTTGIKALVIDSSARVLGSAYQELGQSCARPGWVEQDPEEIWAATGDVIARTLEDAAVSRRDVSALGIANQRETTILWERATGRPVAPAIGWQCRRSAAICERVRADGLEDELRARTGLVVDPYFSATKIMWLLEEHDGLRARAEAGEIAFGTVDTWLVHKLTSGEVHATEPSNASRTLLFGLEAGAWDDWILDRLAIPSSLLAEVRPSSGSFGAISGGPLKGVPIASVLGDQQAALCGHACFQKGMTKNTYGTGSFVLMNTGAEAHRSTHGLVSTAAWSTPGTQAYALEGSIFSTGAVVKWLRDGLGMIDSADEMGPLAASVPDSGGTYLVPAFTGLGAPHWDPHARGAWVGITQGSTPAHLARAAVEAMAFQTRDVTEAMSQDAGLGPAELRVDGGASAMDLLCQFQADQLGIVVRRPAVLETTALGAAYLAGLAQGVWDSIDEAAGTWTAAREFEPRGSGDMRDSAYEGWKKAVGRARQWTKG